MSTRGMTDQRLGPISFHFLLRAHRDLARSPQDRRARTRFDAWCKAAGRCLGLNLTMAEVNGEQIRVA